MDPVRIADEHGWVEMSFGAPADSDGYYPVAASFQHGGLAGEWTTALQDPRIFADELESLHRDLRGKALLSDNDCFSVSIEMNSLGRCPAKIQIKTNWAFGVEGRLAFEVNLDQSHLPSLYQSIRSSVGA